jgi:TRAP-type C4-dicarboxylate transport system substrate-binding protein
MWDGLWLLANKRSLDRLPADLQVVVAKHINAAGVKEREDIASMSQSLQRDLTAKGMVFNQTKSDSFRDRLRKSGFYAEWKEKFGAEAWTTLEQATGKLS